MMRCLLTVFAALLPTTYVHASPEFRTPSPTEWQAYWHQGKAEVTSYKLTQSRYGTHHIGHSVLIFVTEPFSRSKQVKLDNPKLAPEDATTVLKLNNTRKFATGIYPYSTMSSVFSPTDNGSPIKVTFSAQEWCGQVYMQLNHQSDGYRGKLYSYFEDEGDQAFSVPNDTVLEDALWTQIRMNPKKLPVGKITILPSLSFLRFRHLEPIAQKAETRWVKASSNRWAYEVTYTTIKRSLRIEIDVNFPFAIFAWTEGPVIAEANESAPLVTQGTQHRQLMIDYWRKNRPTDQYLRTELGLP